jgi:hypothetical protein
MTPVRCTERETGASLFKDRVGFQDPTQMRFATDDYVIETLATDRSDQPFSKAILPG